MQKKTSCEPLIPDMLKWKLLFDIRVERRIKGICSEVCRLLSYRAEILLELMLGEEAFKDWLNSLQNLWWHFRSPSSIYFISWDSSEGSYRCVDVDVVFGWAMECEIWGGEKRHTAIQQRERCATLKRKKEEELKLCLEGILCIIFGMFGVSFMRRFIFLLFYCHKIRVFLLGFGIKLLYKYFSPTLLER
jgi:hypothetical protein